MSLRPFKDFVILAPLFASFVACGSEVRVEQPGVASLASAEGGCGSDETTADGAAREFVGTYDGHKLRAVSTDAIDNVSVLLFVDEMYRIELTRVARIYCGNALGLYGDRETRDESVILLVLRPIGAGGEIEVEQFDLSRASGVSVDGILERVENAGDSSNTGYVLKALDDPSRVTEVAVPSTLMDLAERVASRQFVVEVSGRFVEASGGGGETRSVLLARELRPVPD